MYMSPSGSQCAIAARIGILRKFMAKSSSWSPAGRSLPTNAFVTSARDPLLLLSSASSEIHVRPKMKLNALRRGQIPHCEIFYSERESGINRRGITSCVARRNNFLRAVSTIGRGTFRFFRRQYGITSRMAVDW